MSRTTTTPTQPAPESGKRRLAGYALIALGVLLCYWPVFRADFVWDDDAMLTANRVVQSPNGLGDIWFSTNLPDYWPLTYSSFWLEWRLWGMNATGYHVTNILLHAASAMLLWRVLRRMLPRIGAGAWVAALIFAVHPVNVESVAWIAERKNTLSLMFCMLAVLWYLRSEEAARNEPAAPRYGKWYWFAVVAFVLSLLAKTSPVLLPVVLLFYNWWRRPEATVAPAPRSAGKRGSAPSPQPSPPRRRGRTQTHFTIKSWVEAEVKESLHLAPFFLAALALGLATLWFQTHRAIGGELVRTDGFASRLAGAGWAVWFYLYKALVPLNLMFVYPRWVINAHSIFAWVPLLALIAGGAWLWKSGWNWSRAALFALGSYVLLLLPVLGFFNIFFFRYSLVADHWQYFALPCVIVLVVSFFAMAMRSGKVQARQIQWVAAAVVVLLTVLSWRQAQSYESSKILWRDTLKKDPNSWLALNHVGTHLFYDGQVVEAEELWRRALAANPNFATTHINLGMAAHELGRVDEAIARWRHALTLAPKDTEALNNLGDALYRTGQKDEGIALLQRVLEINGRHDGAYNNLGFAMFREGQVEAAIATFHTALQLNPKNADASYNLGVAEFKSGRVDEAIRQWQHSLTYKPKRAETCNNLGYAFFSTGRPTEAIPYLERAIGINPNHITARNTLAKALAQVGRAPEAIALWRYALERNPQSLPERNGLAWLLATCPVATVRNGVEAVTLAEKSCEIAGAENSELLGTLAAAYAEAGRFADAVQTAQRAIKLAKEQGNPALAERLGNELQEYEARRPWREQNTKIQTPNTK